MATAVIVDDYKKITSVASAVLPFRVRFTSIGIEGYSQINPPGIGLQIIGLSNYII